MKNEINMMLQIEELIEDYDSMERNEFNADIQRFELAKGILRVVRKNLEIDHSVSKGKE